MRGAGRSLGVQPVPRFDIDQLRPFEVMFCDHKDYDSPVRGGATHAFVLIDVKTRAKFKIDQTSKTQAGLSFSRIMAMNGVHKLPYKCRIYSDGCGSMKYVEKHATRMGIDHAYTPPHEASLNEAEKTCDRLDVGTGKDTNDGKWSSGVTLWARRRVCSLR